MRSRPWRIIFNEVGSPTPFCGRPFFMEIWLSPTLGFDFADGKATIYGSGENKISYISLHNVADFTVAALSNAAARNAVLELGGPEALTQLEVVRIFEKITARTFEK